MKLFSVGYTVNIKHLCCTDHFTAIEKILKSFLTIGVAFEIYFSFLILQKAGVAFPNNLLISFVQFDVRVSALSLFYVRTCELMNRKKDIINKVL